MYSLYLFMLLRILLCILPLACFPGSAELKHSSAEPITGYVQVKDSRIYYEISGKGKPLILLHGGFMDHRMWFHQADVLSGRRMVITCDMRGSGLTVNGDSAYLMSEGIRVLADSLHLRQFDLVGHSMGAIIALDMAIKYPERVRKLVLYSPGSRQWSPVLKGDTILQKSDAQMREAYFVKKDTAMVAELFIRTWFDGPFRRPTESLKPERAYALRIATDRARAGFKFDPVLDSFPVGPHLKDLRMPTLLVTGDLEMDRINAIADSFRTHMPQIQRAVIPGASHMANMERYIDFNSVLAEFLSR